LAGPSEQTVDRVQATKVGAWTRLALFGGLLVLVGAAVWVSKGGSVHLDLASMVRDASAFGADHPELVGMAFLGVFALGTLLMLPGVLFWGAAIGGYLFGWPVASGLCLIGGLIGAVALFASSRKFLGPIVVGRLAPWLSGALEGVRQDGFSYMLAMRFLFVPYPVANLLPGLMGARLGDFVATTAIGLLPSVIAYAVLGHGVGQALLAGRSVNPVTLTLELIPVFCVMGALALLPVAYRHLARRLGLPDMVSRERRPSGLVRTRQGASLS
jgi:uncharacterized membrane protein YdjX (TVP38/TMEM64 family)